MLNLEFTTRQLGYSLLGISSLIAFLFACICLWFTFGTDNKIDDDDSLITLMAKNIASVIKETVFTKLFLMLFSVAGFLYMLYMLHYCEKKELTKGELLSGIAAMIAPILTYALQGFTFSKDRKLNSLLHIFYKNNVKEDEEKFIREI